MRVQASGSFYRAAVTVVKTAATCVPRRDSAALETIETRTMMSAYSTRPWPSSSRSNCDNQAITYGSIADSSLHNYERQLLITDVSVPSRPSVPSRRLRVRLTWIILLEPWSSEYHPRVATRSCTSVLPVGCSEPQ